MDESLQAFVTQRRRDNPLKSVIQKITMFVNISINKFYNLMFNLRCQNITLFKKNYTCSLEVALWQFSS